MYVVGSTYKYISGVPFFFVETQTRLRRYSIMNIIVVPHLRKLPETVKKKFYQNWSNNHITPGGIFYQKYFFFFFFFEVINMFRPKNSQNFTNQNWSRSQNSKKKINQSWSRSHYPWWYFLPKKKKNFFSSQKYVLTPKRSKCAANPTYCNARPHSRSFSANQKCFGSKVETPTVPLCGGAGSAAPKTPVVAFKTP